MTSSSQHFTDLMQEVRKGDEAHADQLARDMIAAGFAHLRIHRGARHCVEIADAIAHDFTNDVLGLPICARRRP